jgi:LmbE family N-acetylglucosaminyl deacetylase
VRPKNNCHAASGSKGTAPFGAVDQVFAGSPPCAHLRARANHDPIQRNQMKTALSATSLRSVTRHSIRLQPSLAHDSQSERLGRGGTLPDRPRLLAVALGLGALLAWTGVSRAADTPLRIICFGAHPDDCEIQVGGTAALWAAKGHKVKLVSVTNGDIGHWREAGGPLYLRRKAEAEQADSILGVTTEILDIHDGELEPTLENRRKIIRLIREWKADIVMSHRPNDYHPDHRYTGVLVQDAAYMVTVPFICPDVPPLQTNPVFFYYPDNFQKPNPFAPDVVVSIDSVMEKKLDALGVMVSQFAEGGANGNPNLLPADPEKAKARHQQVRQNFTNRQKGLTNRFRSKLAEWYGEDAAQKVQFVEAFEICEYGRRPDKAELAKLFPFFPEGVQRK